MSTKIQMGRKYFINIGSVGQPRDGDWRSSYATYDIESQQVEIHRLEYDLQTAQKKFSLPVFRRCLPVVWPLANNG